MPDKTWKQAERAIARRLQGARTGCTGRTGPDVVSGWCCVEVKTRKTLPRWLKDALAQARANTWGDRLPLVVLHETGQRHSEDIVCLRLADFEAWYGNVPGCSSSGMSGDGGNAPETAEN